MLSCFEQRVVSYCTMLDLLSLMMQALMRYAEALMHFPLIVPNSSYSSSLSSSPRHCMIIALPSIDALSIAIDECKTLRLYARTMRIFGRRGVTVDDDATIDEYGKDGHDEAEEHNGVNDDDVDDDNIIAAVIFDSPSAHLIMN